MIYGENIPKSPICPNLIGCSIDIPDTRNTAQPVPRMIPYLLLTWRRSKNSYLTMNSDNADDDDDDEMTW